MAPEETTGSESTAESTASTSTESTGDAGGASLGATENTAAEGGTADTAAAAAAAANQFTPDYKFKVMDKEHEIPEGFRGIIKDAKTQKEAKEIFEKAYGLDHVKQDREMIRKERDTFRGEAQNFKTGVEDLRKDYQRQDFESFFRKLNIPEEQVLQYFIKKAQYEKLPPEQRAIIDAQKNAEQRAYALETQTAQYQEQAIANARLAKQTAMDFSLARPEIHSVAQAFDSRIGKPGAFREAVRAHGEAVWLRTNGQTDLSPQEAIKQVMELYGISAAQAAGDATLAAPAATPGAVQKPKVIPNIQGAAAASPVGKSVRSLDDVHKIYKEKYGKRASS